MLAENLFKKIGYTDEEIREYKKYKSLINDDFEVLARETVLNNASVRDTCKKAREITPQICEYTADLMLILECTGYLLQKYRENNIPDDMFYNSMMDIYCKTKECVKAKNVFGTFVAGWYDAFFKLNRFAFGRLQFDITRHDGQPIKIGNRMIENGDFVLYCHIPSMGPLLHEQCIESYKKAYEYFKDKLKDDILVVRCNSWLLMPDYMDMFKNCTPNIYRFAMDYNIIDVNYSEQLDIAWRIFNVDLNEQNTENLPQNTKLQKGFVEHINKGGKFGVGNGILFFDGANVL